ncbi:MAG: hypothetical protein HY319_10605 [Armatimonadetes bacterium]|nr:hypothetical protein [Armatimonadota bacterium]
MFKRILNAAGLPGHFSPYSLRHRWRGRGCEEVSQMLGHSDAAITLDVYSHVSPSMQLDVAARMSQEQQ